MNDFMNNGINTRQFRQPTDEDYLELAKILEIQNGRPYSIDEAKKVGNSLMTIYTILANGRKIIVSKDIKGHVESNFFNRGGFDKNKTD
jgi:hypothetical protein